MAIVKCPSCGTAINVAEKKTGLWWGLGCLVAVFALPVILAIIGILAAIAIPSFAKARGSAQQAACVNNLRTLSTAKEMVLVEKDVKPGDAIPDGEIAKALGRPLDSIRCPKGGHYTLNPAGQDPECSVHGDGTPSARHKTGYFEPPVER